MESRMRSRLLECLPEADENGDGELTKEELHSYWQSRIPEGAVRFPIDGAPDGAVTVTTVVRVKKGDSEQEDKWV